MLRARLVRLPGKWYAENRVLFWICLLIGVNQLGFGSIVPTVPLYAHAFGVSQSAIGLTIAIYGLARFALNLPAGQLSDRVGRRGALAIGGLVTALGNLLCALAPAYLPFVGARFVAGAGAALVLTASQIVLADISTPERRGRIMSVYWGVFLFSVGIGPLPGGLLAERFGLAAPFYAFAGLGAAAAAVAWFRVPETAAARPAGKPRQAGPPFATQIRVMAARPGFALVCLISFCNFFARTGALFSLIPVLGQERLGLGADQIGLGLAMISVVGLLLAYPSGVLVDRFGRKAVIVPSTLLTGLSFILFPLAPSFGGFLLGCLAWSVASGLGGPAPGAYAADIAPAGMNAAALSAYRMVADLGYVAGPLATGLIVDLLGMDAALLSTAGLLALAAALFGWLAPETYRRSPRPA